MYADNYGFVVDIGHNFFLSKFSWSQLPISIINKIPDFSIRILSGDNSSFNLCFETALHGTQLPNAATAAAFSASAVTDAAAVEDSTATVVLLVVLLGTLLLLLMQILLLLLLLLL